MTTSQMLIMGTIILYLCFVIVTGIMIGRRSKKSAEGFYLGGRGMGPIVTAMSAEASDMSSWLLMGLPGVAYLSGVADASWTAIGLAVGTYLNFLLVARRIRRYSVQLDAITIPSFISKRYGEKKPIVMCIASLIILIFFVPYVASGLAAIGKLFNSLFGWEYMTAVIIGAIVIFQRHTLHFQKTGLAVQGKGEVKPGIPVEGFCLQVFDFSQSAAFQPFSRGDVGCLRVHVDKPVTLFHGDQVVFGFSVGIMGLLAPNLRPAG